MSKPKRYRSVSQMVHAISDSPGFANALDKRIAERQIVKRLISLRSLADMSQKDIAKAMQCSVSRIAQIETGKDGDLRLDELRGYLAAAGCEMRIVVGKLRPTQAPATIAVELASVGTPSPLSVRVSAGS